MALLSTLFIDASKMVGLIVNAEKTNFMLMSYQKDAVQNQCIKIDGEFFGKISKFRYWGTIVTNQI